MQLQYILNRLRDSDYSKYYQQKPGKGGSKTITYIPWHSFPAILDSACDGAGFWEWEVSVSGFGSLITVTGKLTISDWDGNKITRSALGNEKGDCEGWGDATSNATAQAFRRAIALYGVGLELWQQKTTSPQQQHQVTPGTISREEWLRIQQQKKEVFAQ